MRTLLGLSLVTCMGLFAVRVHMEMLSFSSKPVNGWGLRHGLEAPRYARMSLSRYMACRENLFTLMNHEAIRHRAPYPRAVQTTGAMNPHKDGPSGRPNAMRIL